MKINRLKKLTAIAVSVMIALGALNLSPGLLPNTAYADGETSGTCGENLTWSFDDFTGTLTISGEGEMENYSSGSETPWYAFKESIEQVVFDGAITSIGDYAFYHCHMLAEITIPDSVTSIGDWAFENCSMLTSITIPDSVTGIGNGAFYLCINLKSVLIGNGVESIGDKAFQECHELTSIDIPDSVTSIGDFTFFDCGGLTSITIPGSITSIGDRAFSSCNGLESITVDADNPVYHSANNCLIETESKTLIAGCKNSVIPGDGSVISIGTEAFRTCTGLTSITIPAGVLSIGYHAFWECYNLISITIGNGVESIGDYAFEQCFELASVNIPDSVTSIGMNPLWSCSGLESITVDEDNPVYHSSGNCLIETESKTLVAGCKNSIIPDDGSVISIGDRAFSSCGGLTSITIPASVTSICNSAFDGSGIEVLNIENGVTSIGRFAFAYCYYLTEIAIPASVASIEEGAFASCGKINSITVDESNPVFHSYENCLIETGSKILIRGCKNSIIPNDGSVMRIDAYAFSGYSDITNIIIPDGVTSIGKEAFFNCTELTSITIPDSVTTISDWAFEGCSDLTFTDVYYAGSEEQWNNITIGDNNEPLLKANIHYNSSGTCGDHLMWMFDENTGTLTISGEGDMENYTASSVVPWKPYKENISNVVFNGAITSIGDYAFEDCTQLTRVTIPDSVTSIGDFAFGRCTGLTSITIPGSVTSVGRGVFSGCTGLESISVDVNNLVYHSTDNCLIETASKKLVAGCKNSVIPDDGSVTSIGRSALSGHTGFSNITIPDSVTSIGDFAFGGCTGLISITIPDSVTSIGEHAFYYCIGLTSVSIPDSITSIGESVFSACTELTSVIVPSSVKSIGYQAFFGCSSLLDVYYSGSEEQWNNIALGYNNEPLLSANIHFNYKPVNHDIDYGGLDRGISDPIIINYPDAALKLTVTALTPQENEGFDANPYGCSMKFELAPAEDGAAVSGPVEILVSKDFIGTKRDSIVVFQYVTNADGTRSRVSYTFSKNDSRYRITDNGDGRWKISVYTISAA